MNVSHIIYKVPDLDKAVKEFRQKGFEIEYGSAKNPYNAIIYFSEGPYIELMASTGMPKFIRSVLRLVGKQKFAERMDYWENHNGGYCGLALENYKDNLESEKMMLKKNHLGFFQVPSKRRDTKDRLLQFICIFPDDLQFPFLMTYFNIDPKPKNFIHPNGSKKIKRVVFGTRKEYLPIIRDLCDDAALELFDGEGVKDVVLESSSGQEINFDQYPADSNLDVN